MAEFRTEVAGLQIELGKSIRGRPHDLTRAVQKVDKVRIVVNAVKDEVVLFRPLPVGHKISGAAAASVAKRGCYTSRQLRDINPVASVQWRIVDFLRADDLPDSRVLRLQQGRVGVDLHGLRNRAERKLPSHVQ